MFLLFFVLNLFSECNVYITSFDTEMYYDAGDTKFYKSYVTGKFDLGYGVEHEEVTIRQGRQKDRVYSFLSFDTYRVMDTDTKYYCEGDYNLSGWYGISNLIKCVCKKEDKYSIYDVLEDLSSPYQYSWGKR